MAEEQEKFKYSVNKILESVMFENWLRFYFITEMYDEKDEKSENEHLFLIIPEKAMNNIKNLYPDLLPLAEFMNNKEMTFALSQQAVCTYVVEHLDGVIMPRDTAGSIMDSMAFQAQLQLFNTWIQLHEIQLEQTFMDFSTWQTLFTEWKESAPGKDLQEKLILSMQHPSQQNTTVQ